MKIILTIVIFSLSSLSSFAAEQAINIPGIYHLDLYETDGNMVQRQFALDPIILHGFDKAHGLGLKGDSMTIAFLEEGVNPYHPQFKQGNIKTVDCSQYESAIGEDKALYRHRKDFDFRRLSISGVSNRGAFINEHGNHVMGVSLSQPRPLNSFFHDKTTLNTPEVGDSDSGCVSVGMKANFKGTHPGGCTPEAQGILYSLSVSSTSFLPYNSRGKGSAILSINQMIEKGLMEKTEMCMNYYATLTPKLSKKETEFLATHPLDTSPIIALKEALKGPAFAINWSFIPRMIMDPSDNFKAPEGLLNELANLAETHDKVIIFCAYNANQPLEDSKEADFYHQILNHAILSKRVLFAVNVCPASPNDKKKKIIGELEINGQTIPFKKYYSSNYPGESLKNLCLSAVGSNIFSGDKDLGITRGSGTSEAAPVIASLATLMKSHHPEMTGVQIIERLKETAKKGLDPNIAGMGYVWTPSALGIN